MVAWTRLVAVEMVRSAKILNKLEVRTNKSSEELDVGHIRKRRIER